ncbi:MAG: tRNA(Ile)-lysidine synthetase, partial [Phenylobacterium sp.]|nr:tRNA(Ile)-lysidine synthetase [Phenylobacterium sp.]
VDRLVEQIATGGPVTATLAGARLVVAAEALLVAREAGEAARGGLGDIPLEQDRPQVWDGRYEVQTTRPGLQVGALAGRMARLPPEARRRLAALPPAARKALPILSAADGEVRLMMEGVSSRSLVQARFEAATGQISREPSLNQL